jgi:signal transduction histidine kinase
MVMVIDGVGMKSRSLFKKSMVLIIVPIFVVVMLLGTVSKYVVEDYFRDDSFRILNRALEQFDNTFEDVSNDIESEMPVPPSKRGDIRIVKWSPALVPMKSVQTSLILRVEDNQFKVIGRNASLDQFELDQIIDNDTWPLKGETELESEKVFYSIIPVKNRNEIDGLKLKDSSELYYIAYISETYSADLSRVVFKIFLAGLSILLLVVAIILFNVFKHMTRRLDSLEKGATAIGKGDFDTKLLVEPNDEIGRLGEAMNRMSCQLEMIQKEQAEQYQMISHELKTPIMVMQGYVDALLHNQYPNGTKEASYGVLNDELFKLEKLTQDIIILNKLDYLSKNNVEMTDLSLRELFIEGAERMNLERTVEIIINGEMKLIGDMESWQRVIENLLSNNIRYARKLITVDLGETIRIRNDGPQIEEHLLSKIKKPFIKGKNGRSGLGLTIVTNILSLYHFKLELKNHDNGVEYIIKKEL